MIFRNRNKSVLVLCPKQLNDNWITYRCNYVNNPIASGENIKEFYVLAVQFTKLFRSSWKPTDKTAITLSGLNPDTVWENIVKEIGEIQVRDGKTLSEQIAENDDRERIAKQIADLEKNWRKNLSHGRNGNCLNR
ncbi:MAG: hypothetical protein ACI3Y9_02875 [Candidatus Cryptobacteroides sp.]